MITNCFWYEKCRSAGFISLLLPALLLSGCGCGEEKKESAVSPYKDSITKSKSFDDLSVNTDKSDLDTGKTALEIENNEVDIQIIATDKMESSERICIDGKTEHDSNSNVSATDGSARNLLFYELVGEFEENVIKNYYELLSSDISFMRLKKMLFQTGGDITSDALNDHMHFDVVFQSSFKPGVFFRETRAIGAASVPYCREVQVLSNILFIHAMMMNDIASHMDEPDVIKHRAKTYIQRLETELKKELIIKVESNNNDYARYIMLKFQELHGRLNYLTGNKAAFIKCIAEAEKYLYSFVNTSAKVKGYMIVTELSALAGDLLKAREVLEKNDEKIPFGWKKIMNFIVKSMESEEQNRKLSAAAEGLSLIGSCSINSYEFSGMALFDHFLISTLYSESILAGSSNEINSIGDAALKSNRPESAKKSIVRALKTLSGDGAGE